MISHVNKLFIFPLAALALLVPCDMHGQGGEFTTGKVLRVIDGDTLETTGGERVRLLGIDAPEKSEDLYDTATARLRELTSGVNLTMEVCTRRDTYGRLLATVRSGAVHVNVTLLREGMALPMLIPPCGTAVAGEVLRAAAVGATSGKGIYSLERYRIISHLEAEEHIGKRVMVRGKVLGLYKGPQAWHLNFGEDYKTDFTAVLFREGRERYGQLGIDPAGLVGSEVLVMGKLKRYNGPEVIVRGPEQILPLEEQVAQDPEFKIQIDKQGERQGE